MRRNHWRLARISMKVARQGQPRPDEDGKFPRPVVVFNASTRITGISLNAAFSMLSAWGLQMAGVPVIHFASRAGMSRCVLGTNREDFSTPPPCDDCIQQSRRLLASAPVVWFEYHEEPQLAVSLQGLGLDQLTTFQYQGMPLGQLALPALRWVLRRHTLVDDEPTRFLYRQYILSAYQVGSQFNALLDEVQPQAVLVFNGMFFPEASARWVALQRGIRVVAHEVGLRPFTGFFTTGEPTAYPIDIPEDFDLSAEQNARLDEYLSQRFKGNFSMAGVRFWPEMGGLDADFLMKASASKQIVPVFTNVIFDTSQPHSNVVFPTMFAWLDTVLEIIRGNPTTLFVIRAHPDEKRPGKESRESVCDWVERRQVRSLPNVVFVDSHELISSYELIQRSKFVMVYNSTIGLEAAIMGAPVLCGGKARFTQLPTVFFPRSAPEFRQKAEEFLIADQIEVPKEFVRNARRFLYYQLFRTSLPFDQYIQEDGIWPGFVHLRPFPVDALRQENSATLRVIVNGILKDKPFIVEE